MIIAMAFFLLPLYWVIVGSTKSDPQLFGSYGLSLVFPMHVVTNLKVLFTFVNTWNNFFLPLALAYLFLQRYWRCGLTVGARKWRSCRYAGQHTLSIMSVAASLRFHLDSKKGR